MLLEATIPHPRCMAICDFETARHEVPVDGFEVELLNDGVEEAGGLAIRGEGFVAAERGHELWLGAMDFS